MKLAINNITLTSCCLDITCTNLTWGIFDLFYIQIPFIIIQLLLNSVTNQYTYGPITPMQKTKLNFSVSWTQPTVSTHYMS